MKAIGSQGLPTWLAEHGVSLALSTYRANRLILLGQDAAGQLKLHERLFDRPMGLCLDEDASGQRLWMATRSQLWRLDNMLAAGQAHEGGDRLFVPALSYTTADVNAHEIALLPDGRPVFVNTAFSCLATVQPGASFAPLWQPPFIAKLAPDDRCHLNGLSMVEGVPTWATACGTADQPAGWRDQRTGGGVVLHIPTNSIAASGLSMPHSPRWHGGKLWLLNSGTGELGFIEDGRFTAVCALPGFARGLDFVGETAVVGLSKLRSPQFTGLPLEQRLQGSATPAGCCGLRVVDLETGEVLHALDLPEPIDELFDVVVVPGARQPRALGLQAEDIQCLVKLPGQDTLVTVRPKAPSGNPHQAVTPSVFGLPAPATADHRDRRTAEPVPAQGAPVRYQQVFQLTPQTLAPYAALTFPSLAPGSARLAAVRGELLGVSAMADGTMVGLAIAERDVSDATGTRARLLSLTVAPALRRQGVGTRMLAHLQRLLLQQGITGMGVQYKATGEVVAGFEPLLRKLRWSAPQVDLLLLHGSAQQLAALPLNRASLQDYEVFEWARLTQADAQRIPTLGAPASLVPAPTLQGVEQAVSLGLRHQGALVGWLVAYRVAADSVRFSSLFIAAPHRRRGLALALLNEAFQRQQAAGIAVAKAAIDVKNPELVQLYGSYLHGRVPAHAEARSALWHMPELAGTATKFD